MKMKINKLKLIKKNKKYKKNNLIFKLKFNNIFKSLKNIYNKIIKI